MRKRKRKRNKGGFTLAELLIVVAIIGVLVAISVPVFTSKLEEAREATDIANMRSAKAAAAVAYLDNSSSFFTDGTGSEKITMYYDADQGRLVPNRSDVKAAYGKGTNIDGKAVYGDYYNGSTEAAGKVIEVTIHQETGEIELNWVDIHQETGEIELNWVD